MLTAKTTVLVHFKPVRVVLLALFGVVITLFTFLTCQRNLYSSSTCSHFIGTSLTFRRSHGSVASLKFQAHKNNPY
jgi:hypothetical protein